jgi:hypothetical protein
VHVLTICLYSSFDRDVWWDQAARRSVLTAQMVDVGHSTAAKDEIWFVDPWFPSPAFAYSSSVRVFCLTDSLCKSLPTTSTGLMDEHCVRRPLLCCLLTDRAFPLIDA